MRGLHVAGNLLGGMIPSTLGNISASSPEWGYLDLSRNSFSSVQSGFSQIISLSIFQKVDISQNQLSGSLENILPEGTGQQDKYLIFNVSHNHLTGSIPIDVTKTQSYNTLDLSNNQLTGTLPMFFQNVSSSISFLLLQNNRLTGDIVEFLLAGAPGIENVVELWLGSNLFTGDLSKVASGNCTSFQFSVLDLSNNKLEMSTSKSYADPLRGVLECFMGPYSFEIWMGGNNFSGVVLPTDLNVTLEEAGSLSSLDLSNNHLGGKVFSDALLRKLSSLEYLDLSNNNLIGPVPQNLSQFIEFEVANNSLYGPLPTILPGSTLYNLKFFSGNNGLCGAPLPPCTQRMSSGVQLWVVLTSIGGSLVLALGSCCIATWRWRVYQKKHQQDAELIKRLDERLATLMELRDLKKATNNFAKSAQIGEGGFGAVYLGKLSDGRRVAIKRSKRQGTEKDREQFLNEVTILSQINHRHLVKLLGCCMESQAALLVFEFVSNGTLQEHLQRRSGDQSLSWGNRLNIAIQTAEALNYLHSGASLPIYHRDVKSANILLDEHFNAKVADFGLSRLVPTEATHVTTLAVQGTLGYIDPDYYTSFKLNDRSDVYSFGVVLLELLSAKPAIDFQRGGDDASLVNFARPHIESRDLEVLIDESLLETVQ